MYEYEFVNVNLDHSTLGGFLGDALEFDQRTPEEIITQRAAEGWRYGGVSPHLPVQP